MGTEKEDWLPHMEEKPGLQNEKLEPYGNLRN